MTERIRPYVTTGTFADPTPWEALRNIYPDFRPDEGMHGTRDLAQAITIIEQQLADLNSKGRSGVTKREERQKQRDLLVPVYKALLQVHLSRKGGK